MPGASRKPRKAAVTESEHGAFTAHLLSSTQWRRDHGPQSRREKVIKQQLLTELPLQYKVEKIL